MVGFSSLLYSNSISSEDAVPIPLLRTSKSWAISCWSFPCSLVTFISFSEQKLLQRYYLEPLEKVGYEGVFGLSIFAVLVAIMSPLPCSFGVGQCVFNSEGFAYLEQPLIYARQVFDSNVLILLTLVGMVSIATFNITGVTVTKEINAPARSICDVGRTVLVWAAGIGLALTAGMLYPQLHLVVD